MAESLSDYINKLKKQQKDSGKGSLEWYLDIIKKLAATKAPESEEKETPKTTISSAEAIVQARKAKNNMTFEEAVEITQKSAVQETTSVFNQSMIGKMLFFQYDAKTKDKLPYWDMFPLVFLFRVFGNYALGMNMHYLPPVERARLMMALWSVVNTKKLDDHSRLLINYKLLNNAAKFVYFKPCIKKYLLPNIRSRVMTISPLHWNQVLMLPLSRFMKNNEYHVWQDSVNKIRNATFKN